MAPLALRIKQRRSKRRTVKIAIERPNWSFETSGSRAMLAPVAIPPFPGCFATPATLRRWIEVELVQFITAFAPKQVANHLGVFFNWKNFAQAASRNFCAAA
jgi:hypothetical protein